MSQKTRVTWTRNPDVLVIDGHAVAEYRDGAQVPRVYSPRPFLHPVTTIGGQVVSEVSAPDHPHHLGWGLALPNLSSTSYWGGPTWVSGEGYVLGRNHGQVIVDERRIDGSALREHLTWKDSRDDDHLDEVRTLTTRLLRSGWMLQWSSALTPLRDTVISSPAADGRRDGGGYGGVFCRLALPGARLLRTEDPSWIAVAGRSATIILRQPGELLPWFARADEYVGAGPAVAAESPLTVRAGDTLALELDVLVSDHVIAEVRDTVELVREMVE